MKKILVLAAVIVTLALNAAPAFAQVATTTPEVVMPGGHRQAVLIGETPDGKDWVIENDTQHFGLVSTIDHSATTGEGARVLIVWIKAKISMLQKELVALGGSIQ